MMLTASCLVCKTLQWTQGETKWWQRDPALEEHRGQVLTVQVLDFLLINACEGFALTAHLTDNMGRIGSDGDWTAASITGIVGAGAKMKYSTLTIFNF